ncbi:hypothetical protein J6590_023522 [Homalodisca vitripennis]|nr:hypothetical protein J6590_023522 [Homalodisca vitripennis]
MLWQGARARLCQLCVFHVCSRFVDCCLLDFCRELILRRSKLQRCCGQGARARLCQLCVFHVCSRFVDCCLLDFCRELILRRSKLQRCCGQGARARLCQLCVFHVCSRFVDCCLLDFCRELILRRSKRCCGQGARARLCQLCVFHVCSRFVDCCLLDFCRELILRRSKGGESTRFEWTLKSCMSVMRKIPFAVDLHNNPYSGREAYISVTDKFGLGRIQYVASRPRQIDFVDFLFYFKGIKVCYRQGWAVYRKRPARRVGCLNIFTSLSSGEESRTLVVVVFLECSSVSPA